MKTDRYLKAVLTIIALELGWLALTQGAAPVLAQRAPQGQPVVITGIQLTDQSAFLPVGVMGQYRSVPAGNGVILGNIKVDQGQNPLRVHVDTTPAPLRVDLPVPIVVNVEPGQRPIRTEEVNYRPAQRPGE